jgi:DNA-binding HxlR family transcriptional regulator
MQASNRIFQSNNDLIVDNYGRQRFHDLLSVLSNKSSLLIFELASKGTIASKTTLQKLQLSKAQYYRKLKQLCDLGLVMREEEGDGENKEAYKHTPLGEIVYQNQVVTLKRIAADNNIMDVVSKFVLKNKSSNKSFRSAISDVSRALLQESGSTGLWNLGRLRFFETIQDYDSYVVNCASCTKTKLYLTSRSLDLTTIEAVMRTAERGAKVSVVYMDCRGFRSTSILAGPLGDLLLAPNDKVPNVAQLLQGESSNVSIYRAKIPYSFVVSDNLQVGMEIADPEDRQSFFGGVSLESSNLATKLVSFFDELAKRSETRFS